MVGICIVFIYYMYIMYVVYYFLVSRNKGERCVCEIIYFVFKSLGIFCDFVVVSICIEK